MFLFRDKNLACPVKIIYMVMLRDRYFYVVLELWFYEYLTFLFRDRNLACPVKIVYTAMHGVGYEAIQAAFKACNFKPLIPVVEQVSDSNHSQLHSAVFMIPLLP